MEKMTYHTAADEIGCILMERFYYKLNDKQCDAIEYARDNMRNRERRLKAEEVVTFIRDLLMLVGVVGLVVTIVYALFTINTICGMIGVFVGLMICTVVASRFWEEWFCIY